MGREHQDLLAPANANIPTIVIVVLLLRIHTIQMSSDIPPEILEYIKEYFRFCDLNATYDVFQKELKHKLPLDDSKLSETSLFQLFTKTGNKTKKEQVLEKQNKVNNKKYQQVLQAGRQIFSVAINILQLMNSLRDVAKLESLASTIQNYKIQLGKHHKIIINQGRLEGQELITEATILEHKQKLEQNYNEKNIEGMIQFLLSLRVNALQIAPELRRNLVNELIRRDIFKIYETERFDFVLEILNIKNRALRHAMTSLISVICSSPKGVDYITYNSNYENPILQKVFKILKQQQNGNVTQRFCLAILQKCSTKQGLIKAYLEHDMINWTISLIRKSFQGKIHPFCLDFSTAMVANIIHSKECMKQLEKRPDYVSRIIQQMLALIKENIPVSVLMHLLICLTFLNKRQFKAQIQQNKLADQISDFASRYAHTKSSDDSDMAQVDRKTVLDLCSHMFHIREDEERGESKEDRNEQEPMQLIFQCFQDEVN